ncbi:spore germination protein [Thalassobacillus cyri]|uniref:Spore germination protein n=1 Tax=Thalassobacillus cyri TaxID=571932 RepID=A0A1H4EYP3_9BACI|nr:Ger(x)C family spore germination protein [Thalassobacillus cyri]SEA89382.1 spore germination protein [Thalassobacillus cyri]
MEIKKLLPIMLAVTVFLAGCMPHPSVEEVALVSISGCDYVDEELTECTVAVPIYGRSKEEVPTEQYLSYQAKTMKEIGNGLESKSPRPIRMGKLSFSLYGEDLAKRDLSKIIDMLARDPHIGRDVQLGVVEGDTKELIETKYSENQTTADYLIGLIEQNEKNIFPKTNLHTFLYAYYAMGMDGYLPYLLLEEGEVKMDGLALFQGGKSVHLLPYEDVFTFKMMVENFKQGIQAIELEGNGVVLENIGSKVKYQIKGDKANPKFVITVDMAGIVSEVSDIKTIETQMRVKKMEAAFSSFFEDKSRRMITQFQKKNIDPLGLGHLLKNRKGKVTDEEWKELYPEVSVEIKVNVDIVETGISA